MKEYLVIQSEKNFKIIYFIFLIFFVFFASYFPLFFIFKDLNFLPLGSNEASHLIVAKSILSGSPPYTEHFDARGPLFFYILSSIFLFGNFLINSHFLYLLLTYLSAIVVYFICRNLYGTISAIFASISSILILSQSFTAENLIFLFLSLHIFFSFKMLSSKKYKYIILSALFMSCAVLIRFNVSILALMSFLFFLVLEKNKIKFCFIYILSGLLPLIILIVVYANYSNGLNIFYNATINYHLNLTHGRPFYLGLYQFLDVISSSPYVSLYCLSIVAFVFKDNLKKENLYLFVSLIFGIFSILLARKFNIHYLLTVAPFFIILSSSIFSITFLNSKKVIIIFFFIILIPPAIENIYIKINNFYKPNNFDYALSKSLENQIDKKDKIFSSINGVYLYLNKKNYLRIVDQSHFNRSYNYKSLYGKNVSFLDEFKFVFSQKPKFLIFDQVFKDQLFFNNIKELIKNDYKVFNLYNHDEFIFRAKYRKYVNSIDIYILKN